MSHHRDGKKKKKLVVNELEEVDVLKVSLVGSGANQIPFRLFKSEEDGMINLETLFKSDKQAAEPFVASIVVSKSSDLDKAKAQIEKLGYSTEDMKESGDVIIFKQEDAEGIPTVAYKLKNTDMAFEVAISKGFEPMDFETASFKELFAKTGVLPNMYNATDTLMSVIGTILFEKSDNPKDATKQVRKALKEYSQLMEDLVSNIPVSAFKSDFLPEEEEVEKSEEEDKVDEEKVEKSEEEEENKEEAKKDDEASEEEVEKSEDEAAEEEQVEKSEDEAAKEDTKFDEVLKAIGALSDTVANLQKSQEDTAKELEGKIEGVKQIAKQADEAINGITTSVEQTDRETTKKSEQSEYKPLVIDTAYEKRRKSN